MKTSLFTALVALLAAGSAQAACECRCVNGDVQAICTSPMDMQPQCPPRACAQPPPAINPLQTPRLPPVGTAGCQQLQVQNPSTGRYELRTVCR